MEDEISDIDFSGFEEEFILEEIPTIDDRKKDEEDGTDAILIQSNVDVLFQCAICKKKYKSKRYYDKHVAVCGKGIVANHSSFYIIFGKFRKSALNIR